MKTIKIIFTTYTLLIAFNINAQEVPTNGRKTIEVKESFVGEYNQIVRDVFSTLPKKQHLKKLPKKLAKYGFTNVVITEVGRVEVIDGWANKLSKAAGGNKSVGRAKLTMATTYSEMRGAVNQIHNGPKRGATKFQANFTCDQGTFKVRMSTFGGLKYIIKISDVVAIIKDGKVTNK